MMPMAISKQERAPVPSGHLGERCAWTAVLLAGGESRRMGADKAALVFKGEPLWQKQLSLLRAFEPQTLWISARTRPAWCPPDVEVILDEAPSRGPLSGIAAVLSRMRTTHLLTLAVDMPAMSLEFLEKLRNLARPGCGVVPVEEDLFEPLSGIYPVQALSAAVESLKNNQLSLQRFAQKLCESGHLQTCAIQENERALFQNLNEPRDLS
jgi:molybdopterin-guanine dinucleotide biosynthesis protein A